MAKDGNANDTVGRNPDFDLLLAFFGSVLVGVISPAIPLVAGGWIDGFSRGWLVAVGVALALFGAFVGVVWGILNVIASTAAPAGIRRTVTVWMFTIFFVAMQVVHLLFMRGVADV